MVVHVVPLFLIQLLLATPTLNAVPRDRSVSHEPREATRAQLVEGQEKELKTLNERRRICDLGRERQPLPYALLDDNTLNWSLLKLVKQERDQFFASASRASVWKLLRRFASSITEANRSG